MKKLAVFLISLILISGMGLYVASGAILAMVSTKVLDYITANVKLANIEYTRPSFNGTSLSSWNAVTWADVSLNAKLVRDEALKTSEDITLHVGEMTISIEDFAMHRIRLSLGGLNAVTRGKLLNDDVTGAVNRMEGGYLEIPLNLAGFGTRDILAELNVLKEEIQRFSVLGVTSIPISFSATEKFDIQGKACEAKFSVIQEGDAYRLVMDKNDLVKIAATITGQKPNPIDITVIAHNPLKAPYLLKVRDKASVTAQLAAQQDPKVPEDAYRHTLWSYLLTKMYGEQFAKEVTDAHEAYADEEEINKAGLLTFSAASYQDLVNNAVGRQYAAMGYPESGILERVLTDPAIIRDNEVKKRFNALEYEKLKPAIIK
ncbi:MAG: hypothetical protein L7F78_06495 [Syntrophales bacterium LBB04]|nr:hypothetical protein [Syntrophales bacterium LBB04]